MHTCTVPVMVLRSSLTFLRCNITSHARPRIGANTVGCALDFARVRMVESIAGMCSGDWW